MSSYLIVNCKFLCPAVAVIPLVDCRLYMVADAVNDFNKGIMAECFWWDGIIPSQQHKHKSRLRHSQLPNCLATMKSTCAKRFLSCCGEKGKENILSRPKGRKNLKEDAWWAYVPALTNTCSMKILQLGSRANCALVSSTLLDSTIQWWILNKENPSKLWLSSGFFFSYFHKNQWHQRVEILRCVNNDRRLHLHLGIYTCRDTSPSCWLKDECCAGCHMPTTTPSDYIILYSSDSATLLSKENQFLPICAHLVNCKTPAIHPFLPFALLTHFQCYKACGKTNYKAKKYLIAVF